MLDWKMGKCAYPEPFSRTRLIDSHCATRATAIQSRESSSAQRSRRTQPSSQFDFAWGACFDTS